MLGVWICGVMAFGQEKCLPRLYGCGAGGVELCFSLAERGHLEVMGEVGRLLYDGSFNLFRLPFLVGSGSFM